MKYAGNATVKAIIDKVKEALGLKLDKADVVDNLTTDDATKALSAAQGKKLLEQIAANGNGDMLTATYDPDSDGKVKDADHADEADHAASADSANEATHAGSADSAEEATHAGSADSATTATSADSATTAATATSAASADTAKDAEKLGGKLPADYVLDADMEELSEEDIESLWSPQE